MSGSSGWLKQLTLLTGQLFAVIRTFGRYEKLNENQQADIRAATGWPLEKDAVLSRAKTVKLHHFSLLHPQRGRRLQRSVLLTVIQPLKLFLLIIRLLARTLLPSRKPACPVTTT